MNTDIRLDVTFFEHPKTLTLIQRCGEVSPLNLMRLWIWAALHRPDGDLSLLTDATIETIAGWKGEPGKFIEGLLGGPENRRRNFIDGEPEKRRLHNWKMRQGWAANAEKRSRSAKQAADEKWRNVRKTQHDKVDAPASNAHTDPHTNPHSNPHCEAHCGIDADQPADRYAPSPSPSPSPFPSPSLNPNGSVATGLPRGNRAPVENSPPTDHPNPVTDSLSQGTNGETNSPDAVRASEGKRYDCSVGSMQLVSGTLRTIEARLVERGRSDLRSRMLELVEPLGVDRATNEPAYRVPSGLLQELVQWHVAQGMTAIASRLRLWFKADPELEVTHASAGNQT